MRSLIVEMIDELVTDLAKSRHEGKSYEHTMDRLKDIREQAERERSPRIGCSEQLTFPFVEKKSNTDSE